MGSGATSASFAVSALDPTLAEAQARYQYMPAEENQIHPICMAKSWPWRAEQYAPSWILPFLPQYLAAQAWYRIGQLRRGLRHVTFRFDKIAAYREILAGPL